MSIRRAKANDLINIKNCNLRCLAECYKTKEYINHIVSWPQVNYVAEDDKENLIGYVLAEMNRDVDGQFYGYVSSLAVNRSFRRQGIGKKLMEQSMRDMSETFAAKYVSLHVRISNKAALHLYKTLGFETHETIKKCYLDHEDAYLMRKDLRHQ